MSEATRPGALGNAIRGQWRLVTASTVLYAMHQGSEALVPVLIGVIIDEAVTTRSSGSLVWWLAVLAAVFIAISLSFRYGARFGERASYLAAHLLRLDLTRRVLDHRGGAEAGRLSGELVNIATNDAKRVGVVNLALPIGAAGLSGLLVAGTALLQISVALGLIVLLGTPLLLGLAHLLGKPLERRSDSEQQRAALASGMAADLVSGLRVLKGIGAVPAAVARYRRTSRSSLAATVRAARAKAWHDGGMLALTGLMIAVIALVGGRLAAQGEISVGGLVAAVGLAQFLLGPLEIFAFVNGELAQGRASAKRIDAVLSAPTAVRGGTAPLPEPVRGRIRLRGVTHGPLRKVDLDIEPGSLTGVVTTDPRAATALLECLGRSADPPAGSVELDGHELSTLDLIGFRRTVLVAAHDADLFEESLLDNVTAGARRAALDDALRASAADEVARTLPAGTDTVLAERGRSLSGGQRQRVALARALAAEPQVLVLHDPTTAVDAMTEARIASGLRAIRAGRTTILVTTNPALLGVTERVLFVDGGAVTAQGDHHDLLADERYRATVLA
ncbi:ABC transporter ATP-binding protein [Saccharopolyspora sp. 5N708]|uniref:ABC transporter ATP-binding protein n=1 Tax=Saccharopolyspora sp. 5N708 TaxID=3457424 RepID=UPI003FD07E82